MLRVNSIEVKDKTSDVLAKLRRIDALYDKILKLNKYESTLKATRDRIEFILKTSPPCRCKVSNTAIQPCNHNE